VQINSKKFRSSGDIENFVPVYSKVISVLDTTPGIKTATGRLIINGMASSQAKSSGVEINGIDIAKEKEMFSLSSKLIPGTGSYFNSGTRFNSAFIGEKLAKELNIIRYILTPEAISKLKSGKIPDEVIDRLEPLAGKRFVSEKKFARAVGQLLPAGENKKYGLQVIEAAWSFREGSKIILSFIDINNIQTGAGFRVSGVFRTNNDMFEATSVFVPIDELRKLTGVKEGLYHRIIVRLDNNELTDVITPALRKALPGYEVQSWKEIQPDLAMLSDMMQQVYAVFMIIILAALAFGILNTMLMAVLERTRELGMLAAIGMNRRRTFVMIMLESVFLSIVGGATGMGMAGAVISATAKKGINLVKYSEGMEAFGYSAHLFPSIDAQFFITTSLLIILTGILSSVYPAQKALKLNPVEAIRTE
jgi:ABC-type lipoprotein release transport system permease subunit